MLVSPVNNEEAKEEAKNFMLIWCPDHCGPIAQSEDGVTWHVQIGHMHFRTDHKGTQESRYFTCDVKDGSAPQNCKCEKYPNPDVGKTRNDEQYTNDDKDKATITF
jgi:hypothetical protein